MRLPSLVVTGIERDDGGTEDRARVTVAPAPGENDLPDDVGATFCVPLQQADKLQMDVTYNLSFTQAPTGDDTDA